MKELIAHSVEQKVRHIVEDVWMPDADYRFFNWYQASAELDGIKRPVIMYVLPAAGKLYLDWNQTTDCPNTQIAFLVNTDFDFKSEENDRLMQYMKVLASQFIEHINSSGLFEKIPDKSEIPYQAVYDRLPQNVTGIIITLDLRELKGIKHCPR